VTTAGTATGVRAPKEVMLDKYAPQDKTPAEPAGASPPVLTVALDEDAGDVRRGDAL
jgi:hypothetical protein